MNCQQLFLEYLSLTKRMFWRKNYTQVNDIILSQLEVVIAKIKKANKYIDPNILMLK